MPKMIRTARQNSQNFQSLKSVAHQIRERQLEYQKVQAQMAPKLKVRQKKQFRVLRDNEYEERKEENQSAERDCVKGT